jgi:hypothetical protein
MILAELTEKKATVRNSLTENIQSDSAFILHHLTATHQLQLLNERVRNDYNRLQAGSSTHVHMRDNR